MIRVIFFLVLLSLTSCMLMKQEEGAQESQNKHMENCHGPDHHHNARADHKSGCNRK